MKIIVGIDFGAQLAGTTAIACLRNNEILIEQNKRGRSSDSFVEEYFSALKERPGLISVDAPLSLPQVYSYSNFRTYSDGDFHFRECDRVLGAMSPMFLGGLTARAMEFAAKMKDQGWLVHETYPKAVAQELKVFNAAYKRSKKKEDVEEIARDVANAYNLTLVDVPENWNQLDAVLAVVAGLRFMNSEARKVGDPDEGMIYI